MESTNYQLVLVEHFLSLQGEGAHSTLQAYFLRLGGCNVMCEWCDSKEALTTNSGKKVGVEEIVDMVENSGAQNVVITGGEPTIYNLTKLTLELKNRGKNVWLETSGTNPLTGTFDWITLSPKQHLEPLEEFFECANELKIIVGGSDDLEFAVAMLEKSISKQNKPLLYLQPQWEKKETTLPLILKFIDQNPHWRLSLQTHKYLGIL